MEEFSLIKYKKDDIKVDIDFWEGLYVNYDFLITNNTNKSNNFSTIMNTQNLKSLQDLCGFYNLDYDLKKDKKSDLVDKLKKITDEEKTQIILLNEFSSRKKNSVIRIYNDSPDVSHSSTTVLAQLIELFKVSTYNLVQIHTHHNWLAKNSGDILNLSKNISFENLLKLTNEYKRVFMDHLYMKSGNIKHKIYSYYSDVENQELIIEIYKQKNDLTKPDFIKTIKNKDIQTVLLKFDAKNNYLEIKSPSKKYVGYIEEYIQTNFDVKCTKLDTPIYEDFEAKEVIRSFMGNTDNPTSYSSEVVVNEISINKSRLTKSPEISLKLSNLSVLPGLSQLYENEIIQFNSLKDINYLNVKFLTFSKKIKTIITENGDIFLTYNDNKMSPEIKDQFQEVFKTTFKIPLLAKISNIKFSQGKSDKVDYLLRLPNPSNLTSIEESILEGLINDKLVKISNKVTYVCKSCEEIIQVENPEEGDISCECGSTEIEKETEKDLELDESELLKNIKNNLKKIFESTDYKLNQNISKLQNVDEELEFITLTNSKEDEILQFYIAQNSLSSQNIKRIIRTLTPTIIIAVGMTYKEIESLKDKNLDVISFGELYYLDNEDKIKKFLDEVKNIKNTTKTKIAKAADLAINELKQNVIGNLNNDYTDKMFEDDVYAILKDIFINAVKWGKEKSGKAVPEGLFSLSTTINQKSIRSVYSFDCKFTKSKEGYDLKKEEQRKAVEYVNKLNQDRYIQTFSINKGLNAHVFISNKFRENQLGNMQKHFSENIQNGVNTVPIFLDIRALVLLHSLMREHMLKVSTDRNVFFYDVSGLLQKSNIKEDDIKDMFETTLDRELAENRLLTMSKIKV